MRALFLILLLAVTASAQQTTLLSDDFNTDGRDVAKWNLAQPVSGSNSGSVTLTEVNATYPDKLHIVGPSATGGTNLGGYESASTFNCSTAGCVMVVEVVETEKGRGHTVSTGEQAVIGITLGTEWWNGITVQFYDLQKWELLINQSNSRLLSSAYIEPDSVDVKWFRFRITTSTAWIDTSPDGLQWTNRTSVAHSITLTAFRAYLWAGTFGSQTTAFDRAVRAGVFDNFTLETMPYNADAGSWQTVVSGATVNLSGATSTANGATVTARQWTCTAAVGATCPSITNATSEAASFTAPTPSGDNAALTFQYDVTAGGTVYRHDKMIYAVKTHADGYVTVADAGIQAVLGYVTPRGSGSPNRVGPMEGQLEERVQIHGDYAADIGGGQIRGVFTINSGNATVNCTSGCKFTEDICPSGASGCTNLYGPKLLGAGAGIVRFDGGGNPDLEWAVAQVNSDTQLILAASPGSTVTLNDATTTFTNGRISSTGGVYSNVFPEGINYYDFVWVAYQYAYRSGNPKYMTIADRFGKMWATGMLWRGGRSVTEAERRMGARGLMIWAIRNPSEVAEAKLWDQMQDQTRARFDFLTDPSRNIIDVRETSYMLLHASLLAQALPNTYDDRVSGTNTDGATKRTAWAADLSTMFPNWLEPQQKAPGWFEMNGVSADGTGSFLTGWYMSYTQPFMEGFTMEMILAAWPVLDATGRASAQRVASRLAMELYSTNRKGGAYTRTMETPNQPGFYHRGTQYIHYGRVSNSPELATEGWDAPVEFTKYNYQEWGWQHEDALRWHWLGITAGNGTYIASRSNSFQLPNAMGVAYYITGNPYWQEAAKEALDAHAGTNIADYNYGYTDTGAGAHTDAVLNGQLTGTKPFVEGFRTALQTAALINMPPAATVTLPGAPTITLNASAANQITINLTHGSNATRTTIRRSENPDGPFLEVRNCQHISASTCVDGSTSDPTGVGRYGPRNGRSYYYKAYSINGGGFGTDSARLGPIALTATSGVPNSPTALTCVDAAPSATNYFACSWTAPASGPAPTGYRVEYSYESRGTGSPVRWMPYSVDTTAGTTFTFNATNLVVGTVSPTWNHDLTYFVRVYAYNGSGESSQPSNEDAVRAISTSGGAVRGATVLPATPSALPSLSRAGTSVTVTFPATPSGWHHWIVKRKDADDKPFTVVDFSETGASYVDTVPSAVATYYYAVSSADSSSRMAGQSFQVATEAGAAGSTVCSWNTNPRCSTP